MNGSCAVRGRRFAQPCRKNWPISPGPSCSSEPHSSLPGPATLEPPVYDRGEGAISEKARSATGQALLTSVVLPPLREGDVAGVDRDQLDPRAAGGDLELLTLLRGQLDPGGRRLALVPGRGDHPAVVEEQGVAGALQQSHRDVVAGRVQVARVTLAHPQDEHVGRQEPVAGGRVAVRVVVSAVSEDPRRDVYGGELSPDVRHLATLRQVLGRAPGEVVRWD